MGSSLSPLAEDTQRMMGLKALVIVVENWGEGWSLQWKLNFV